MNALMNNQKPVILIGNGGHAKVLYNILKLQNTHVLGCAVEDSIVGLPLPILGNDALIQANYQPDEVVLVNGIGSTQNTTLRKKIYEQYKKKGYHFASVIHPSVILPIHCKLGEGVQLMAGVVIQPDVEIGENSIVNTRVSIDHDCKIGNHVHLAPGTTLSGNVQVSHGTHIGTGTTIIQGITIGSNSTIGAGSVVTKNIPATTLALGIPAKEVRKL